jgi:hypothetical protein
MPASSFETTGLKSTLHFYTLELVISKPGIPARGIEASREL